MHNIFANITMFRQLLIEVYRSDNMTNGNKRQNSNQPIAIYINIIDLAIVAESMKNDSENRLYSISS